MRGWHHLLLPTLLWMWLWRWRWLWLMWLRRVGLRSLCLLRWWSAILRPLCHLLRTLCFGLLGLQLLVLLVPFASSAALGSLWLVKYSGPGSLC